MAGSRGRLNGDVYTNLRLTDQVAMSFTAAYQRRDGLGDFLLIEDPNKEVGEMQDISGRVALKWTPTESLSFLVTADGNDGDNGLRPYDTLIDELGAERIDHGVAIAEDRALMARVAAEGIPLTVCPRSNVVIANRFASLEEHPLLEMRDAGLLLTINTDDPAMMEWDLGREYRAVGEAYGLAMPDLHRLAVDGVASTWLDDSDRRSLAVEFEAALANDPILRQGLPVPSDPA